MTRQDGPLLVGALNENSNVPKPLKVNDAGELLVTSGGGGGATDVNLTEVGGAAIALGQAVMAASLPVVIASNQTAIPISGSVTTGGLTDTQLRATPVPVNGTVAATQSGTWNITNVSGTVSLPTGAATAALQTQPGVDIGDVTVNNGSGASAVNVQDGGNSLTVDYATTGSGTATGALRVELPTNGTGVIATVGAVTAITNAVTVSQATASSLNAQVVGSVASGATDSGNPVKTGYAGATAAPSAVTAGQRVNALGDVWGRAYVRTGEQAPVASTWTAVHIPNTNVQATITKASAGSGKRNVCTGFVVTLCAGASTPTAAAPITVMVVDGATGGTTYLWRSYINLPAVAGAQLSIVRTGLWLVGSQATAMTIEFSAAGGSNTYESVAIDGVICEE